MNLKLFEYAVLLHPDEDEDGKDIGKTEIIVGIEITLAADEKQAAILIARTIPEEHMDSLARVEIIIRPF